MVSLLLFSSFALSTLAIVTPSTDPNALSPPPKSGSICTDGRPPLSNGLCMPTVYDYCFNALCNDGSDSSKYRKTSFVKLVASCSTDSTCVASIYVSNSEGYISHQIVTDSTKLGYKAPVCAKESGQISAIKRITNPTKPEYDEARVVCPADASCSQGTCGTYFFYHSMCSGQKHWQDCLPCPDNHSATCETYTGISLTCQDQHVLNDYGRCIPGWAK